MVWRLATWLGILVVTTGLTIRSTAGQSPQFAPGVVTEIPPEPKYSETYSGPMELVDIVKGLPQLDWTPNYRAKSRTIYQRAKKTTVRRTIWNLEFAFKPLRMLMVDVPQPGNPPKMQRKRIWYMVYRVRYYGNDLAPEPVQEPLGGAAVAEKETKSSKTSVAYTDKQYTAYKYLEVSHEGRFFFPQFLLESLEFNKTYQDRIIPAAKPLIEQREMHGQRLLNSVEMSREPIPLSSATAPIDVWGVVTWEDVDPRIDFFSVYVKGLTNAYKLENLPDAFKAGDPPGTGVKLHAKMLRLNFWRPGDTFDEHEGEIYFGVPIETDPAEQKTVLEKYGLKERVDYLWVYR